MTAETAEEKAERIELTQLQDSLKDELHWRDGRAVYGYTLEELRLMRARGPGRDGTK